MSPFFHKFIQKQRPLSLFTSRGVKTSLRAMARGRKVTEAAETYQLREPSALYGGRFGTKKLDIAPRNTYLWNVYVE